MRCVYVFGLVIFALIAAVFGGDCDFDGKSYKTGDTFQKLGECNLYTCTGKGSISAKTCPAEATLKPCQFIPGDNSKPYPQCCPRHKC